MIADQFDEKTLANMEVALERACERFPEDLSSHKARASVAASILERVKSGDKKLNSLTSCAVTAAIKLHRERLLQAT